jgi:hypothetical protein
MIFEGDFCLNTDKNEVINFKKFKYLEQQSYASPTEIVILDENLNQYDVLKLGMKSMIDGRFGFISKRDILFDRTLKVKNDNNKEETIVTLFNTQTVSVDDKEAHLCSEHWIYNLNSEVGFKMSVIDSNNERVRRETMPDYSECYE